MKACKIIASLLFLQSILSLRAGSPVQLQGYKESVFSSSQLQPAPCKSILFIQNNPAYKNNDGHKRTGWMLLGIGAGALTTGTILLSKGLNDMVNSRSMLNSENSSLPGQSVPNHDVVLISAGSALAFTGLVLTPTGLIMGIRGKLRYNKYTDPSSFLITPVCDNYGIGMSGYF